VPGDVQPVRGEDALATERLGLGGQSVETRVRACEPAVERIELEQRRVRAGGQGGVRGAEVVSALEQRRRRVGAARSGQRDGEERTDEHRDRHRQESVPGGHGAAP
jgi:hypothetical protein